MEAHWDSTLRAFDPPRINLVAPSPEQGLARARLTRDELARVCAAASKIHSSLLMPVVLNEVKLHATQMLRADAAWICLIDDQGRELIPTAWDGISDNAAAEVGRVPLGEHLSGRAAQEARPVVTRDASNDPRIGSDRIREIIRQEHIRGALYVPLFVGSSLLGILSVQSRSARHFNDHDVWLLCALAEHAAAAIWNAHLYETERRTAVALQETNVRLDAQSDSWRRSVAIHNQFSDLALSVGDLQTIARTLAELTASTVVVENQFFQRVAVAFGYGGRSVASGLIEGGLRVVLPKASFDQLLGLSGREIGAVRYQIKDSLNSVVIAAIVLQGRIHGYLSVLEGAHGLTELDFLAIQQAAKVMAIQIRHQEAILEAETRLKYDFLESILAPDSVINGETVQRAAILGCDLTSPHRVVVASIGVGTDTAGQGPQDVGLSLDLKRRVSDSVGDVVRRYSPGSLIGYKGDTIVALLNVAHPKVDVGLIVDLIRSASTSVVPNTVVTIGVGRQYPEPRYLRRSWDEARYAIAVLRKGGRRDDTAWFERLGLYALFFRNEDDDELPDFVTRTLGPLMVYDQRRNTELLPTLRCYLRSGQNLRRTAAGLSIHVNTLIQRLQRIREVAQIDLEDSDTRFRVELALQLRDGPVGPRAKPIVESIHTSTLAAAIER